MSSTGEPPPPPSWADIAGAVHKRPFGSAPLDDDTLARLKATVTDSFRVDDDAKQKAHRRFSQALYGKLFGKSPPFETVKAALLGLWKPYGVIHIADMPNGYLLIRCETESTKQQLLFKGPWSVNGLTLQLVPWQPYFEPAHTKLSRAMVWLQLHNLPVEFWDGETLESITESIGKLLKVDEFTSSLARARFARVCLEIDLSRPLKRGFWLEDGDSKVFVVILYERLPTFHYRCGIIGHAGVRFYGGTGVSPGDQMMEDATASAGGDLPVSSRSGPESS
ncbi:uncharacterized protein LOC120255988 [Dioscorea cayenensis subsp. rotundata]|uniref:Uncharacterized protein LOC120255988 n=1 Tax=Dioscorea cayennensis subsp. rotundata TaxID=55577 RepID=A0AB40AXI0_DIOCR|nr:uncharacterized protein LOC120255988 [Dioscorea cayenensis subsp. rotundata]